jgi:asparagine synthase (glutamine-hydrolysing)
MHLGTDHHCRILGADDAKRLLPRWGDLYDEPFGDDSGISTLLVSQVAAERVKVVLSADGGDELFSGYNSYAAVLRQWELIKDVPRGLRRATAAAIAASGVPMVSAHMSGKAGSAVNRLLRPAFSKITNLGARLGARSVGDLFDSGNSRFGRRELARLIHHDVETRELADQFPGEPGEQLCLWDLHHYMPGDILTKVDRVTMAASIEGREPLLDHRLIEFAFSLPFDMRRGKLGAKHLLKKVLYRHVPRSLVDRPKQGFGVPVREWLATDLRSFVDECFDERYINSQGLFDVGVIRDYMKRFHAGETGVLQRVWLLLAFQMWYRRWMSA